MVLTNYPFSPFLPSNGCGKFSNSACTILEGSLEEGTLGVRDVVEADDVPLLGIISRMEIRLLRETRSVLEYLCQHLPAIRSYGSHGHRILLQFPQDSSTMHQ